MLENPNTSEIDFIKQIFDFRISQDEFEQSQANVHKA